MPERAGVRGCDDGLLAEALPVAAGPLRVPPGALLGLPGAPPDRRQVGGCRPLDDQLLVHRVQPGVPAAPAGQGIGDRAGRQLPAVGRGTDHEMQVALPIGVLGRGLLGGRRAESRRLPAAPYPRIGFLPDPERRVDALRGRLPVVLPAIRGVPRPDRRRPHLVRVTDRPDRRGRTQRALRAPRRAPPPESAERRPAGRHGAVPVRTVRRRTPPGTRQRGDIRPGLRGDHPGGAAGEGRACGDGGRADRTGGCASRSGVRDSGVGRDPGGERRTREEGVQDVPVGRVVVGRSDLDRRRAVGRVADQERPRVEQRPPRVAHSRRAGEDRHRRDGGQAQGRPDRHRGRLLQQHFGKHVHRTFRSARRGSPLAGHVHATGERPPGRAPSGFRRRCGAVRASPRRAPSAARAGPACGR